jgi:hypothetical protein
VQQGRATATNGWCLHSERESAADKICSPLDTQRWLVLLLMAAAAGEVERSHHPAYLHLLTLCRGTGLEHARPALHMLEDGGTHAWRICAALLCCFSASPRESERSDRRLQVQSPHCHAALLPPVRCGAPHLFCSVCVYNSHFLHSQKP